MDSLLILKNIKKTYTEILKNVNLTLNQGDFVSILGKSRSGKSTFTEILSGRLPLTDGQIWLNGILVNELSETEYLNYLNKNIGFINDTFAPYKDIKDNAKDLIKQAIYQSQLIEEREVEGEVQKWLNFVEFAGDPNIPLDQLYYIERRKAVFARAFASRPKLLVLDEPTNHFNADFILPILEKYNREYNTTVIFLTQIEEESLKGHKRFILKDGVLEKV